MPKEKSKKKDKKDANSGNSEKKKGKGTKLDGNHPQQSNETKNGESTIAEETIPDQKNIKGKKRAAEDDTSVTSERKKQAISSVESDLSKILFDCNKKTPTGEKWNLKISSWNVAGLRACAKKNGMSYITHEDPDIICLQETKCSEKQAPPESEIPGYKTYFLLGEKGGYAGVALYTKQTPVDVKFGLGKAEHDNEGRVITAEYENFYLVGVYVPNAGQGLKTLPKRMKWDNDFRSYLKDLDSKKPVILCGDLNVAHQEIDLANPKTNTKHAGFTKEERDNFTELLKEGFVDTYRHLYPDKEGAYTFWAFFGNARARNTGWRLDYFVVSKRLIPNIADSVIRSQVGGSDHCPVTLFLHI